MKFILLRATCFLAANCFFAFSLYANFEIYGKAMAKEGLTNTVPSGDTFIQSVSSNAVTIDLNSSTYRYRRALNIKNIPTGSISKVEFYINDIKVSEDSSAPYMLYNNGSWLPAVGSHIVRAVWLNSSGISVGEDQLNVIINEPLSHRKRKVFISTGNPNQAVRFKMKNHQYAFGSQTVESWTLSDTNPGDPTETQRKPYPIRISGTALNGSPLSPSSTEMQYIEKYREVFLENFNFSVAGNVMKWYSNGESGTDFDDADRWHQWHKDNNIPVRGHTLLWGRGQETNSSNSREMHDRESVENLMESGQFEAAKLRIKSRIQGIVSHYSGEIDEWDFNNELWNFDKYRKEFDGQTSFKTGSHGPSGDSILAEFEDWAREANPNIKLYHNDYNIITQSSTSNATKYKNLIQDLRDNHGVDVDGVGVQGHFGSYRTKEHITNCFNILDDLGLPIKVTEFDSGNDSMSDAQRANLLENLYRASFEHEMVEAVIMWGFWSGCHWRRAKAPWQYVGYQRNDYDLSNDDPTQWIETPQVDRYQDLVFGEWWTDTDLVTDEYGNIELSAFAGEYDIEIDGQIIPQTLSTDSNDEILYLSYIDGEITESQGSINMITPTVDTDYYTNEGIEIRVAYPNGSNVGINNVEFILNGNSVKLDSEPPFVHTWFDAPSGENVIRVIADGVLNDADVTRTINVLNVGALTSSESFPNGGFESGLGDWEIMGPTSDNTISLVNFGNNSASSMLVERDSTASNHSWHGTRYLLDSLNLTEGTTYQFSADIGTYSNPALLNISATIKSKFAPHYYVTIDTLDSTQINLGNWSTLTGSFVYNSDYDFIYFSGATPGIDYFVDNVSIIDTNGEVIVNPNDSDSDQLLDSWEIENFGDLSQNSEDDNDSDGKTNLIEFRSDTNPNSNFSYFDIYQFSNDGTTSSLVWLGSADKSYRVFTKSNLNEANWQLLEEAIPGNQSTVNFWDNISTESDRFYKVEIDQ